MFVKCLVKGVKQRPLYGVIFQSSSKQFQSNISWPNNNINFSTSSHLHFWGIKSNSLVNFSKFWNIYFFYDAIISNLGKRAQSCISCIKGHRKIKINIWWNFEVRSLFLRSLSQSIAVLTHVVTPLSHIGSKKGRNLYFT